MSVGAVAERTERPAYVRFKRVAVEDKKASLEAGQYVAKNVDFALITPPYSKDVHETKVEQWLLQLEMDEKADRIPREWAQRYRESYKAWLRGEELPPAGTAIRGWGVISPAQQETLVRMNILTVEDLAGINEEGLRRLQMGGLELKSKAKAWLATLADRGPLTLRMAALETENNGLKQIIETLQASIDALKQRLPDMNVYGVPEQPESITASDLLDDTPSDEPQKAAKRK